MAPRERQIPLVPPGEILLEEFLKPLEMTVNALALALRVPSNRIYAMSRASAASVRIQALRLGRYFSTGPEFWINLQAHYDLQKAKDELEGAIEQEVQPRAAAPQVSKNSN